MDAEMRRVTGNRLNLIEKEKDEENKHDRNCSS